MLVVRALNGQVEAAVEMMEGELARVTGVDDVYADFYREYAEGFRKRMRAPGTTG